MNIERAMFTNKWETFKDNIFKSTMRFLLWPKKVKYPMILKKKIGYGLGIAKNYRVGSGIGYPSGPASSDLLSPQKGLSGPKRALLEPP